MGFTWASAGHAFASLFKDIVGISKTVTVAIGSVENEAPLIEALTSLVSPGAASVERLAFGALGEIVAAVNSVSTAASANGINVGFDASVVVEIKALITDFPQIIAQVEAVFPKVSNGVSEGTKA